MARSGPTLGCRTQRTVFASGERLVNIEKNSEPRAARGTGGEASNI